MKKLLIALFSVCCMASTYAQETPSYEIDPVATAKAAAMGLKVGDKIAALECISGKVCYRVFLGILTDGQVLVQNFYENGHKFSDPYTGFIHPDNSLTTNGKVIFWHENGRKLSEGYMLAGAKDNLWVIWYENGQKQGEGVYQNDKPIGVWRHWDEKGNLIEEIDHGNS